MNFAATTLCYEIATTGLGEVTAVHIHPASTTDMSISDEILKRVTESYRRIRNTLRFLLAAERHVAATAGAAHSAASTRVNTTISRRATFGVLAHPAILPAPSSKGRALSFALAVAQTLIAHLLSWPR